LRSWLVLTLYSEMIEVKYWTNENIMVKGRGSQNLVLAYPQIKIVPPPPFVPLKSELYPIRVPPNQNSTQMSIFLLFLFLHTPFESVSIRNPVAVTLPIEFLEGKTLRK
jgi:hypothetical protein